MASIGCCRNFVLAVKADIKILDADTKLDDDHKLDVKISLDAYDPSASQTHMQPPGILNHP